MSGTLIAREAACALLALSLPLSIAGANASWEPDIAVNRSGGEVYVVYRDSRAGSPGIYIAASQDGGQSWAPSVRVDDAPSTTTVLRPSIAVDFTGAVYVAWEDWRPSAALYQIRAAVSTTEGASWSASQQISSGVSPFFSSNAAMAASTAGFAPSSSISDRATAGEGGLDTTSRTSVAGS